MRIVPPEGSPAARYWVCGESPGQTEADEGRPFCGPAGSVLNQILEAIKISRRDCYVTNAIKVLPPPSPSEEWWQKALAEWRGTLAEEVGRAPAAPHTVLLLGGRALQAWTGSQLKGGIFAWRGSVWHQSDLVDVIPRELQFKHNVGDSTQSPALIVPTLHPAFILRGQWHLWPVVVRDAWKAFRAPVPPRPLSLPVVRFGLPSVSNGQTSIVIDLETDRRTDDITLVGLLVADGDQVTIWQTRWDEHVRERLSAILTSEKAALIGHNLVGFDLRILDKHGIAHSGPYHDTITLANVVNPDFTAPREKDKEEGGRQTLAGLDGVSSVGVNSYIQWKGMLDDCTVRRIVRRAFGDVSPYGKSVQNSESDLSPWDTLRLYNAIDLWMTWQAYAGLWGQLDEKRRALFIEEQVANVPHRIEMRRRGMLFDVGAAMAIQCRYERWIGRLERYVLARASGAWEARRMIIIQQMNSIPKCPSHKGFSRTCATCAETIPHRKARADLKKQLKKYEGEFNAQSAQDWRWLLFEVEGLSRYARERDRSPTGLPSIDDDVLLAIQRKIAQRDKRNALIAARLRIARLRKRVSTYLEPFTSKRLLRDDQTVSVEYNDFRTTSGRWSGGVSDEAK